MKKNFKTPHLLWYEHANQEETAMARLIRFGLLLGILLASIFLFYYQGHAASWWESQQPEAPVDRIQVSPSATGPDSTGSAVRSNWEEGYLEVMAGATADQRDTVNIAQAFAVAEKTARHLAYEKLAETVGGLNLFGDSTYDRELMIDSNLRMVVQTRVKNARVLQVNRSQFSDGSIWVEVTLGMNLYGDNGLIRPSLDWQSRRPVKPLPAEEPLSLKPKATPEAAAEAHEAYTGLIIDASGLGAAPAMLPRVLTEDGEVLYGGGEVDKSYVVRQGIMGYQRSLAKARGLERVGSNALVVRAKAVSGQNRCDLVVSRADALKIRAAAAGRNFLKECRVVAVVN